MRIARFLALSLLASALLIACASAPQPEKPVGVEELNPGDRTMIDTPASQPANENAIKERNI